MSMAEEASSSVARQVSVPSHGLRVILERSAGSKDAVLLLVTCNCPVCLLGSTAREDDGEEDEEDDELDRQLSEDTDYSNRDQARGGPVHSLLTNALPQACRWPRIWKMAPRRASASSADRATQKAQNHARPTRGSIIAATLEEERKRKWMEMAGSWSIFLFSFCFAFAFLSVYRRRRWNAGQPGPRNLHSSPRLLFHSTTWQHMITR